MTTFNKEESDAHSTLATLMSQMEKLSTTDPGQTAICAIAIAQLQNMVLAHAAMRQFNAEKERAAERARAFAPPLATLLRRAQNCES